MSTMTVLVDDCFNYPSANAADYGGCIAANL
jgi:hypothetical protein